MASQQVLMAATICPSCGVLVGDQKIHDGVHGTTGQENVSSTAPPRPLPPSSRVLPPQAGAPQG